MSHKITITRLPDDRSDDAEYEIGGECDRDCTVWIECAEPHPAAAWTTCDTAVFHGVEHRNIFGVGWCALSTECGLDYAYDLRLEAADAPALGTYDLEVEWDGEGWVALLVPESRDSGEAPDA